MNYFLLLTLRIIFSLALIENYFSLVPQLFFTGTVNYFLLLTLRIIFSLALRIIFRGIVNLFFGLQYIAGLRLRETGKCLTSLVAILKSVRPEECFLRECQGETLSEKETKELFTFS